MTIFFNNGAPLRMATAGAACTLGLACMASSTWANEAAPKSPAEVSRKIMEEQAPVSSAKEMGNKVREALGVSQVPNKRLTLVINGKAVATAAPEKSGVGGSHSGVARQGSGVAVAPQVSRKYLQARAAVAGAHGEPATATTPGMQANAHGGDAHWAYEGDVGPQSWGKLKPEFNLCALGKRQSPINIEEGATLVGPAEPVQFNYVPSNATVVNNGHTIQVDVQGENAITVRGSSFKLLQFHFHTPSEEQINFKRSAMVAHLVHKNDEGQLAVVAVLLEPGSPNPLIEKVWTYMPLDAGDRVRMPRELVNMDELLPSDQRYYQFMGSLTTPPCSEGVLWLVLKKPMQISKGQYKLFTQLYPNNARPVQPVNGRPVRDAQ
jgi:carbonic anhydrase